MIATILPGSANFHAVGYNEHKVSKGDARLIEILNFGNLGAIDSPTTDELVRHLKTYSSQNDRIRKSQFHVAISCKGHELTEQYLLEFAHKILRRWDIWNLDNRYSYIPIMTLPTPTCT